MRILNLSAQKPGSTGSGVYLTELAAGLRRLGQETAVLAGVTREDAVCFDPETPFFPVYYQSDALPFPVLGMSDSMPYESTRYRELTPAMQRRTEDTFVRAVAAAVEQWRPDVLVCHHLYFVTAVLRERFPDLTLVGVCHGTDLRQLCKTDLQSARIRENIARLDRIFALHEQQRREICRIFSVPERQVQVIGTGYNAGIFHAGPAKRNPNRADIVYAGKLSEQKGVFSLLDALDDLAEGPTPISLTLAGGYSHPEEYARLTRRAERAGYPVSMPGRLTQPELAELFLSSRLFVLPSFFEGLPLVVVEALACGLKVVATDLPGLRPWLDAKVPNHQVEFVTPPAMGHVDEPEPWALEPFRRALAAGLRRAMADLDRFTPPDTASVSWDSVARDVLSALEAL